MVTQILFIYVLGVSSMPVIETSLLSGSSTRAMMVSDTKTPTTGTHLSRTLAYRTIVAGVFFCLLLPTKTRNGE